MVRFHFPNVLYSVISNGDSVRYLQENYSYFNISSRDFILDREQKVPKRYISEFGMLLPRTGTVLSVQLQMSGVF